MVELHHATEMEKVEGLPIEVQREIAYNLAMLDSYYGVDRTVYGGHVLLIESMNDLQQLPQHRIDIHNDIAEKITLIETEEAMLYASVLLLQGSDFGIVLIMEWEILPMELRKQVG